MNARLEDTHVFRFTTTDPVNGDLQTADSLPTVNVYEEATDTPVLTPTAVNVTTGRYRVPVAFTAANGFEAGKVYAIEVLATVGGIAGGAVIAHVKVDARDMDDLAYPATAGRSLAVEADGMVYADAREWLGTAPLALSSQRVQALAGAVGAGVITSTEAPALANLDAAVSTRAAAGDSMALTGAAVDAILDDVVEGTLTFRQMLRLFMAALGNKSSGGGTATIVFRDKADSKARITATVDANGNRTAVSVDGT